MQPTSNHSNVSPRSVVDRSKHHTVENFIPDKFNLNIYIDSYHNEQLVAKMITPWNINISTELISPWEMWVEF